MSSLDELANAATLARIERPQVALAVATLYAVDGSSYRQPGARLLVDAEGRVLAGAVSGGCLEGDVAAHAAQVCASGVPKRLTYDLGDDLQAIWGFGAMCNGVAHLLLEPLGDREWLATAQHLRASRESGALLTVLEESSEGGTRLLAECDPSWCSALSSLVRAAAETGQTVCGDVQIGDVQIGDVQIGDVQIGNVQIGNVPLGGESHGARQVRCLIDPLPAPIALVLVGAGRGAEAFARIAQALGWQVTLIDHRSFVLHSIELPRDVKRVVARADDGVRHVPVDERTAVALLTHQFEIDREWLTALLPLGLNYIGILGSRQRAQQLTDRLRDDGIVITPRMQRALHAPIGLDLGGESPESIALAAIAEIEATMHGRPGGSLRDRHTPIHTRSPTPDPSP